MAIIRHIHKPKTDLETDPILMKLKELDKKRAERVIKKFEMENKSKPRK